MEYKFQKMTIDDVCTVTDCLHKTAPSINKPTEYRMLRTNNIRDGKLRNIEDTKSVTKDIYDEWSIRGYIEPKDVILTREAPMGEVALIGENEDYNFFLGQRLLQLKAKVNVITPEFLYYSLQTNFMRHQIMMNEGTGSVVSNIRIPLLKKMSILVPPIHIQRKLTNILNTIDNKIKINQRIIINLEELSQTLFKRWFIDFEFPDENGNPYKSSGGSIIENALGKMPSSWSTYCLGDYIKLQKGLSYKGKYLDKNHDREDSIPLLSLSNFNFYKGFKDVKTKYYFGDFKERHSVYHGDLIIAATDLTQDRKILGSPAIVPKLHKKMIYSLDVFRVSEAKLPVNFLYFLLQTQSYRSKVEGSATGTTVVRISQKLLESIELNLPKNQNLINDFNEIITPYINKMEILKEESKQLSELRDTLLPKLMSGEIELPDELEVDEHAELLQ